MSAPPTPVAIVTGASSGIGRATALLLAREGHRVFATVRTAEAAAGLHDASEGPAVDVVRADMAIADEVRGVARRALDAAGRVDVLVNNAGYALVGAVEDLPPEDVRRQFEVNVIAPIHLAREVLPTMRTQRSGRIVNVSSLAGRVSVPVMGAYCASKFALEAFSDALRGEARPFGIGVSIVEPGPVVTEFQRNALRSSERILRSESPFARVYRSYLEGGFETGAGATPEQVARVVLRAIRARHPRSRYRVRWRDALIAGVVQLVPRGGMDWALARWMELDRVA